MDRCLAMLAVIFVLLWPTPSSTVPFWRECHQNYTNTFVRCEKCSRTEGLQDIK